MAKLGGLESLEEKLEKDEQATKQQPIVSSFLKTGTKSDQMMRSK